MTTTIEEKSDAAEPTLQGGLGVASIVFMVLAGAAPLTAVVAVIPFTIILSGNPASAIYFIVAAIVLVLFSVAYTLMSKHVKDAGAMYSYISAGFGRIAGSGASTLAVVSYFANMLALYLYAGVQISSTVETFSSWSSPWWLWSLLLFGLVAVLGYMNIDISARVLGVVLVAETLIVVVVDVAIAIQGGANGLDAAALSPTAALTTGAPGLGIMFAFLAFVGFEATAVFRAEAKNPEKTIPRATYISVIGIGVFYALSTWLLVVGEGTSKAVTAAGSNPASYVFALATEYVSPILTDVMRVFLISSMFACLLTLHNVINRYQLAMSQQRLLPRFVGIIHSKHRAPSNASLVLSIASGLTLVIMMLTGQDPIAVLYPALAGTIGYGIIILMAATSAAAIVYFRRTRLDRRIWNTLVAPFLALIGLVVIGVLSFQNIGVVSGSPVATVVIIVFLVGSAMAGMVIAIARGRSTTADGHEPALASGVQPKAGE